MIPTTRFGYLPDPIDTRDRTFEALVRSRPMQSPKPSVDWRARVPQILNQGDLGSCVAHAVLGAIRLRQVLVRRDIPKLGNRLGVYWGARAYIGMQQHDSGSHIRDAFRFINAHGYMPEDETKNGYAIAKFREPPTPEEQHRMFDQRDKGQGKVSYYRIFGTGFDRQENLKVAMSNGVVPVLGTSTTAEFLHYGGGILPKPSDHIRETGGHAFYLCGYDKECVYVANSWGRDFGEGGFMRLAWDMIEWPETRDIWGVERAPYFSHLEEVA